VRELQAPELIVHLATTTSLPASAAGAARFVTRTGGYRYVRIDLDRSLLPHTRAAILGHELQHACEIARSSAASVEAIRALFLAIGELVRGANDTYETPAAAHTARLVWRELRSRNASRHESP